MAHVVWSNMVFYCVKQGQARTNCVQHHWRQTRYELGNVNAIGSWSRPEYFTQRKPMTLEDLPLNKPCYYIVIIYLKIIYLSVNLMQCFHTLNCLFFTIKCKQYYSLLNINAISLKGYSSTKWKCLYFAEDHMGFCKTLKRFWQNDLLWFVF